MSDPSTSDSPTSGDPSSSGVAPPSERPFRLWTTVALGAICLWIATPPAPVHYAEFLIFPGLAAFYLVARHRGPRRKLAAWTLGALHTWAFSWSLLAEFTPGWLLIGLAGGFYWLGAGVALRHMKPVPAPLAFAAVVAISFWARAHMPEILYPHGQPCHALYMWPRLLEPVRWGGEVLANGLLAALSAALWLVWERHPRGRWHLLVTGAIAACLVAIPAPRRPVPPDGERDRLDVVAVELGAPPAFLLADVEGALVEITERAAGRTERNPPDLVLWPESSHPGGLVEDAPGGPEFVGGPPLELAAGVRLIVGATVIERNGPLLQRIWRPCAALLDHRGRYLDRQDKLVCVPGGEAFPFGGWLPFIRELGHNFGVPHFTPGVFRPPLPMADGTLVGGVTCYENTFPWVARRHVAAGARMLAVITNEAWYRQGGELWQMDAMTVCRALETDTPVVRCTVDGRTMAVDSEGRIVAALPLAPPKVAVSPRILRCDVALGSGSLPPMAWLHPYFLWGFVAVLLAGIGAHLRRRG